MANRDGLKGHDRKFARHDETDGGELRGRRRGKPYGGRGVARSLCRLPADRDARQFVEERRARDEQDERAVQTAGEPVEQPDPAELLAEVRAQCDQVGIEFTEQDEHGKLAELVAEHNARKTQLLHVGVEEERMYDDRGVQCEWEHYQRRRNTARMLGFRHDDSTKLADLERWIADDLMGPADDCEQSVAVAAAAG